MKFRLGVNYWPRTSAMQWWKRFDLSEVRDDFHRIAAAGCDCVRLFLLWPHFQPETAKIDMVMLDRLLLVVHCAQESGLDVMPTFFSGHMSGVNWIPDWALDDSAAVGRFRVITQNGVTDRGVKNWYSNSEIMAAQVQHTTQVARALSGATNLWAWDLGNENSNCCIPPSKEAGLNWLKKVSAPLRLETPEAKITIGLHMEDLEEDRNMGPKEAAQVCDFLCMHGYPIYASFVDNPLDTNLVPFLCNLTSSLGGGISVLFAEFGLPTGMGKTTADAGSTLASQTDAALYTNEVLHGLRNIGSLGALVWCYGDYNANIWDDPPLDKAVHERSFGLWGADGREKLGVNALRSFAKSKPRVEPSQDVITHLDAYYDAPSDNLHKLYRQFCSKPPMR